MTKHLPSLLLSSIATVFLTQACSCDPALGDGDGGTCELPRMERNGMCCDAPVDTGLCGLGEICDPATVRYDPADTVGCAVICDCIPNNLNPGILAQQLDATQTTDGTVAISGYSPGDSVLNFRYGDLVVGEYDATADEVTWEPIDGVPPGPTDGAFSPDSWRGGQYLEGDDVGQYSSIVANGDNLLVSYEDTTHRSLKIALRIDGEWTNHVVDDMDPEEGSQAGGALFTSIALDANNLPVIAYGVRVPASAVDQQPQGWIRVARSMVEYPTQTSDWSVVDLEQTVVDIGCLQGDGMCHPDATCVTVGTTGRGTCVPTAGTGDCDPGCTGRQVCVDQVCRDRRTLGDLIDAQGLYNNLVRTADGFALAFYDRSVDNDPMAPGATGGTVWGMRLPDADGDWTDNTRFAIEGYAVNPLLYGDCGISTSLFVDSTGVWHVTFVDGTYERLRYVRIEAGATTVAAGGRSTVDDGYPGVNHRPADRPMLGGERRLVGDGASIVVNSAGEIRILYQDTSRISSVIATCTTGCAAVPVPCITSATCAGDSECNQGFCSNVNWVATSAVTLPEDANASPNLGYYTVQILDAMDTTSSFLVWLERQLQPLDDAGWTQVDRYPAPAPTP